MRKLDHLLVLSIMLSPMTTLRLGKIGPAEALAAVWCLLAYLAARHSIRAGRFGQTWGIFFVILIASTLHGALVTPDATNPAGLFTWGYLGLVAVVTFGVLQGRQTRELDRLLLAIGVAPTLWFGVLYAYSVTVSQTLLGIPLWYGNSRFSGGATNPHQLSLLIAACVFINFRAALSASTKTRRVLLLGVTALAMFIGYRTTSGTWVLALGVTAAVAILYLVLDLTRSRRARTAIVVLVAMVVAIATALQWRRILVLGTRFMDSDDNSWGRLTLWTSFNDIVSHVLVLGLGPGTYAENGQMEFHNSYLELAAMLGLPAAVGVVICLALLLRRLARTHWTLMTILLVLLVYALPGFGIRRLSFWVVVAICLALAVVLDRQATQPPGAATDDVPARRAAAPITTAGLSVRSDGVRPRRAVGTTRRSTLSRR